jgi:hypothetical protein
MFVWAAAHYSARTIEHILNIHGVRGICSLAIIVIDHCILISDISDRDRERQWNILSKTPDHPPLSYYRPIKRSTYIILL